MSGLTICEYYNNGHCLKYDEDCFNQCVQKQVSEDAISREDAIKAYNEAVDELVKAEMEEFNLGDFTECSFNTTQLKLIARKIEDAPSVIPKAKEGEWKWETNDICHNCGYKIPHLERIVGETVLMDSKDWSFCPNCGAKRRGEDNV